MRMKVSSIYLLPSALMALGACYGGISNGAAADEVPQPSSALQNVLDCTCLKVFALACVENPHFCVPAVARRDVGMSAEEGEAWRCYSVAELDFNLTKRSCVDDCGELTDCQGAISGTSLEHLTVTDKLEKLISELQEGMCKIHVRCRLDSLPLNPRVTVGILRFLMNFRA